MGRIGYLIGEGSRGLFQAKLMTVISIATIAVVLFVSSLVCIAALSVFSNLRHAVERADFVVYLTDAASSDETARSDLLAFLRSLPQVRSVSYVDRDSALGRFRNLYGSEMLDAVDGNPLPASFEITLSREHQSSAAAVALKDRLQNQKGVEGVRFAREWLEFLEGVKRGFFWAAVALIGCMIVVLHMTVSNTIKLTIYARKELVRTMHLVGATRFFISLPFIIEGMLQGCIGGAIAMVPFIILKAVFLAKPWFQQMPLEWGPSLLPLGFILTGVLFGWFGSVSAVRKFLT
jgi:cell division transport system permease protein